MAKKKETYPEIVGGHTYNPSKKLPDPNKKVIGEDNSARWVTERNFEHRKSQGYEPVETQDGVVTDAYKNRLMRISNEKLNERRAMKRQKLEMLEKRMKDQRSKGVRRVTVQDGKTVLREE